jgi:hypothetical protein
MGWGTAFKVAYKVASVTAKAAYNTYKAVNYVQDKVADAAEATKDAAVWAYGETKDAAVWAKDKAVAGAFAAKDAVVAGAKAVEQAARHTTRDAIRAIGDKGFDGLASASEKAKSAYNAVRKAFGGEPANCPTQSCPNAQVAEAKATDKDRDGWMMAPQGPGKPCKAIPPGKNSLQEARAQSVGSQSECCKAKRAAGMPQRDIIYVNGINTDRAAHCFTLNAIAAQTCGRVVGVYNATEGMPKDALQTGQDRRLIKAAAGGKPIAGQDGRNPAVDTMARQIGSALRAGEKPEIWAHSQGGAVASLALFEAKQDRMIATGNPNPLAGMKVKSFGSASPKWTDGPRFEHYVHVDDATPSTFGLGHSGAGDAKNAGAGARVIRFSGDPAGDKFTVPPRTGWAPTMTSNHGIEETYLKMEKQTHGGCP